MSSIDGAIGSVLAAQSGAIKSEIAGAVAGKQLDALKQQGEAAAQLVENAAQVGKAVGKGQNFDVQS